MNTKSYTLSLWRSPEALQIRGGLVFVIKGNCPVGYDIPISQIKSISCYKMRIVATGTCAKRSAILLGGAVFMMSDGNLHCLIFTRIRDLYVASAWQQRKKQKIDAYKKNS